MADDYPNTPAGDILLALVKQRYGDRLGTQALEDVRKGIEGGLRLTASLRGVPLANGDEPFTCFTPYCQPETQENGQRDT